MEDPGQQRTALVTGAGRGIGQAVAVALAREGYALCLAARTFEQLEQTRKLTGLTPKSSLIVLIDLAENEAPEELFGAAMSHFGRIDVLVNNAGFAPPRTPVIKGTRDDQDRMVAVNLSAPMALARLAAAQMTLQPQGGTIVNIASSSARNTPAGEAVYAATKAGLVAFTRACSLELRDHGVRMSVILPGLTDTAFIPANKRLQRDLMIRPEEVAAATLAVVHAPANVCPVEVILEPARNPMRGAVRS
jgi:short-subunit dehydrogenase